MVVFHDKNSKKMNITEKIFMDYLYIMFIRSSLNQSVKLLKTDTAEFHKNLRMATEIIINLKKN